MVTIYDIAKEAGASKSTVANALFGKRMKSLLAYLRSVLTFMGRGNLQPSTCSHLGIDILLSSLTNRNKDCAWKVSNLFCKPPAFPYLLS